MHLLLRYEKCSGKSQKFFFITTRFEKLPNLRTLLAALLPCFFETVQNTRMQTTLRHLKEPIGRTPPSQNK